MAARGLDIPNIELVIQLEPPKDTESYIHRSGRTARAGNSGTCITFFNNKNVEFLDRIEQLAGIKMDRVPIPSDDDMAKAKNKDVLKNLKNVDNREAECFMESAKLFIEYHKGDAEKALSVALAYCSGKGGSSSNKSLLTGQENLTTIQMSVEKGRSLPEAAARAILNKYWTPKVVDQISEFKLISDGSGVLFDVKSQDADSFIENYEHLKKSQDGRRVDFEVIKCKALP